MAPKRQRGNLEAPPFGELGRLEHDDLDDTLLRHVCGGHLRNLAQHARLAHDLTDDDYRELAVLSFK